MMAGVSVVRIMGVCTGFCMVMDSAVDSSGSSTSEFCDCMLATTTVPGDDSATCFAEV
jgi:hypothetical protein